MYNFALSMKIGLFPFHLWILNLVSSMGWMGVYLLASVQKIMPIFMLSWWFMLNYMIFVSLMTMLVSVYYSLGLNSLKMIFMCSILTHSSWMSLMVLSIEWWLIYFTIYSFLFMFICFFNYLSCMEDFGDMGILKFMPCYFIYIYSFSLLSFMGIPPLMGFVIKWMIMDSILVSYYMMFIIVMTSVIHLYYYFRVILWSFMFMSFKSAPLNLYFWVSKFNMYLFSGMMFTLNLFFMYFSFYMI